MCLSESGTRRRLLFVCMFYTAQQKGWLCCTSSCHGCPALHRRAGPLAPRDNHSLAESHFFFPPSWLVAQAGRLAAWHDMVTYLRSWWRCVACLLFVCMRWHTFCPLSLFFASYVCGRAGWGWARLGYASWSPFAFVGVVAVLISCSLRSVAWHVTYLDPTSHVCTFCMFSFCLCASLCVVLLLGGPWPPSRVPLSFVGFLFLRRVPSYHFARPWR